VARPGAAIGTALALRLPVTAALADGPIDMLGTLHMVAVNLATP
jgi:hypothetical protein